LGDSLDRFYACKPYAQYPGRFFHYHHHNANEKAAFPPELRACEQIFKAHTSRRLIQELSEVDCSGEPQFSASLYLPGDHSLPHNDLGRSRSVAFVWHLTKDWSSSWGGHFYWASTGTYISPSFNVLILFRVSATSNHLVTHVSPTARGRRLAVNGWWTRGLPTADDSRAARSSSPWFSGPLSAAGEDLFVIEGQEP
jgi:Rps23 Pro-64 3,4-dihydroxylase Tpa1-like proline 4-hydroxylase